MYVPKFLTLHYALRFGKDAGSDVVKAVIPRWRTVFRGIRRHKDVPEDVLHYHRSSDDDYGSIIETVVKSDGLSFLFVANDERGPLSRSFGRGIERVEKALGIFPEVDVSEVRFVLEVALNAPSGREPTAGEALFYLPEGVRIFGDHYDTSLSFRWDVEEPLPGSLVVNVLPMDSKGKHIHGRYAFRTKTNEATEGPSVRGALLKALSLVGSCFEHVPHLVGAVHLST